MSEIGAVAIYAAVVALVLLALWWGNEDLSPQLAGRRPETPAVCAWCAWRAGDDCTHPASPVGQGQPCGPVCAGRVPCRVREGL